MSDTSQPGRPPLVLIANDQEWSARSLESILAPNGYAVLRAYTGNQALERAREGRPDLIILDAQMPDIQGYEVCQRLRQDPDFNPATPIIITTAGPSGRAQRLEAYRAGAWEFLGQPLDGESLLLKLETFLAAKRMADRAGAEPLVDAASGLYSSRGLSRRAREIGSEVSRRREPLTCIVFTVEAEPDQDGAGAAVERVADVLRRQGRASDAIGRLGHAEFAIVAPATQADGVRRLLDRLEQAISPVADTPALKLRAGYYSVPNMAAAKVAPLEMLLRATAALRDLTSSGDAERVRDWVPSLNN
ncbi:MAG: response regulator [Gemmatimonadota bacterium]|nr:response regulator [Gemmatimonadota bacterium]